PDVLSRGRMYDAAASILQQKLSQVQGVGQVIVGGSSLPAVRVELNPTALNKYGIALERVREAIAATNVNRPKGQLADGARAWEIQSNGQLLNAADYAPVIIAYRSGQAVRLTDVASVEDSVEDVRTLGMANGRPSVLLVIFRQPGANIIDTVDRVRDLLPELKASIPAAIDLAVVMDQTQTIRASLHDVEVTLVISIVLVTLVVFVFLRDVRATLIPGVAVPLSAAIALSLLVSLTTTPMMCATLLPRREHGRRGRLHRASERVFEGLLRGYAASLSWVLRHPRGVLAVVVLTIAVNAYLFMVVPKG